MIGRATSRCLRVHRELEVGAALGVEVSEARDVELGELGGGGFGHPDPPDTPPDPLVVDEDDFTVRRQPRIGLEPPGPPIQGQSERRQRVLGQVGPGRPGGRT